MTANWFSTLSKDIHNYRHLSNPAHLIKLVGEFGIGSPPPAVIPQYSATPSLSQRHHAAQQYDATHHAPHHRSKPVQIKDRYTNPFASWTEPSWSLVMKWHNERKANERVKPKPPVCLKHTAHSSYVYDHTKFDASLPIISPDLHTIHNPKHLHNTVQYTWFGHATLLIQYNGMNILIDPHFTQRAAPLSWVGPQRYRTLPCEISDLPSIDLVLISHNHYDHLDYTSIKQLIKHSVKTGRRTKFCVPNGIDRWMRRWTRVQADDVVGLDWWHTHTHNTHSVRDSATDRTATHGNPDGKFRVTAVPAQHWSQRTFTDRNRTLWCGFVIELPDGFKLYYSGDSGYNASIKQIADQWPDGFDVGALPIGAYEPVWFMAPQHWSPADAVRVHQELNVKQSIGVHFGTFDLADDAHDAAPTDLATALDAAGVERSKFIVPVHGHTNTLSLTQAVGT